MRTLFILSVALLLSACDAWPTVVDNRTKKPITVQYLHQDYTYCSAPISIKDGFALPLAMAHWIQEIQGIQIKDDGRNYHWSAAGIRNLASACPSNQLIRSSSFAGNCYLLYLGKGQLKAVDKSPEGLKYDQLGNEQINVSNTN